MATLPTTDCRARLKSTDERTSRVERQSLTWPCEARAFSSIITGRSDETIFAHTSTRLVNSPPRWQLRARKNCTFP